MDSPPSNYNKYISNNISKSFSLLNEKVQKWIWSQNWEDLRDIQERAIPYILNGNTDLIISSPTASGKTEAAFLPIFSKLVDNAKDSIQALYISPLKALINDQFERLYDLSEKLQIEVFKWHGDVSYSLKKKLLANPVGILQTTPESLESLLINHSSKCSELFLFLEWIIVDELHYFVGTERGKQLQSLFQRIEIIQKRRISRIGLSATLGDMSIAETFLRPGNKFPISTIISESIGQETKLQIKGFLIPAKALKETEQDDSNLKQHTTEQICYHLFNNLRGKSNLIFANSRTNVEKYSDYLFQISGKNSLPNEFFPHHGSLSKQIRETVEERLKNKSVPTSAVCTSTLELGIDIGTVHSIAQVGVPPSVASMRQRLGRSGRRGEPAILRIYIEEKEVNLNSSLQDKLRAELFQTVAMIELLIQRWYEPLPTNYLHLSTLLQQILAIIAQYGAISAKSLWDILIEKGPFQNIPVDVLKELLTNMGKADLLKQTSDSTFVLGLNGERIVNNYDFYSVFITPDEYKLISNEGVLGSLPIDFPIYIGMFLIFAGRRWEAINIDDSKKMIVLKPSPGGKAPKFFGSGGLIHDKVRQEMFNLYIQDKIPHYLDENAISLYREGLYFFGNYNLNKNSIVQESKDVLLLIWYGDKVINTLALLLRRKNLAVVREGFCIRIMNIEIDYLFKILLEIKNDNLVTDSQLAELAKNKIELKYDAFLSDHLLKLEYCSRYIDISRTQSIISQIIDSIKLEN